MLWLEIADTLSRLSCSRSTSTFKFQRVEQIFGILERALGEVSTSTAAAAAVRKPYEEATGEHRARDGFASAAFGQPDERRRRAASVLDARPGARAQVRESGERPPDTLRQAATRGAHARHVRCAYSNLWNTNMFQLMVINSHNCCARVFTADRRVSCQRSLLFVVSCEPIGSFTKLDTAMCRAKEAGVAGAALCVDADVADGRPEGGNCKHPRGPRGAALAEPRVRARAARSYANAQ